MADKLSFSVLTANLISLLLIGTLYCSNKQRMKNDRSMQSVLRMMGITAISNVADMCVYYTNGDSSLVQIILMYLSASWLFLANVLIGCTWAQFLTAHLDIPFSRRRKKVYLAGALIACTLLLVNFFVPLVFFDDNGAYRRGPAYSVFLLFAVLYILDSLYLYAKCRKKTGTLKLFPVQVFLVPLLIGVIVQAVNPEIAITWSSVAVAIAGVMTALKNELIFSDRLTGIYNRVYLEFLQQQASSRKEDTWVSGIMIDLNSFKQINDSFGHSEGDAALICAAQLLRKTFSEYGVVTRYAGDEFVVMLNTADEKLVEQLIERAKGAFDEKNRTSGKPYRLSASMGYAVLDLKEETIDMFMNRIDQEMYRDKLAYHQVAEHR